jgi:hypothetical protein
MAGIKAGTSLRIACEEVNGEAPAGRCKLCKYVLRFLGREFLTQTRAEMLRKVAKHFCPEAVPHIEKAINSSSYIAEIEECCCETIR